MTARTKWKRFLVFALLGIILTVFMFAMLPHDPDPTSYGPMKDMHFAGCTVLGETVQFRYAMTYHNSSQEYDITIDSITGNFKRRELSGWFGVPPEDWEPEVSSLYHINKEILTGYVDNEEGRITIPAGQNMEVVFVFEGTYLGGELPDHISVPDRPIWTERISSD